MTSTKDVSFDGQFVGFDPARIRGSYDRYASYVLYVFPEPTNP